MQIIDIITSILLLVIAIVWTLQLLPRYLNIGKKVKLSFGNDAKSMIGQALAEINADAEWSKDNDTTTAQFVYQGGHFIIETRAGLEYANVSYPFMYDTGTDKIDEVRTICNLCNLNSYNCRIFYTVSGKENKVYAHFASDVPMIKGEFAKLLRDSMGEAFRWQATFSRKMDDLEKDSNGDQEKQNAEMEGEIQLLSELEMTHNGTSQDWHETRLKPYSVRHLLSTVLGIRDLLPISMNVTMDSTTQVITDTTAILDYEICDTIISDNKFERDSAFAKLDFYDPKDLSRQRHLMIDIETESKTKDTLYYRVTFAISPTSMECATDDETWNRQMQTASVLIGYELTPYEERLAHFKFVCKEAMGKMKQGDEAHLSIEEKIIVTAQGSKLSKNFYEGRRLYIQRRFYEAIGHLVDAYHEMEAKWTDSDRSLGNYLCETAYLIACSYMSIGQYEIAGFYIETAMPFNISKYTKVYIDCLINRKDYRAIGAINALLTRLEDYRRSESEDMDDDENISASNSSQIDDLISFAKRRKAYLLISLGRYDEAETILKKMLNEAENKDFAINELAYIQKNRNKQTL